MDILAKERPVGTETNTRLLSYLEKMLAEMGYAVERLPFSCTTWESNPSSLILNDKALKIHTSPFSQPFNGVGRLAVAQTLAELEAAECRDGILILGGELTASPMQPKNYPFYYPDEHRYLIELLEKKHPAAIIAATGKHPLCGLSPFPLFEDGNFLIPSAYVSEDMFDTLQSHAGERGQVSIHSTNTRQPSYQLVATKRSGTSKGKIVLCAHKDTKYQTVGALDNAAGLAVLLETAEKLADSAYDIDIVPFNGEEYYEASGEVAYLHYLDTNQDAVSLVINIDSPCHIGSKIAVSLYNFDDTAKEIVNRFMETQNDIVYGAEWYAGDHAAFVFRGIPCMVLTSPDLFEGGLEHTHTMRDTIDTVDQSQIEVAASYIRQYLTLRAVQTIF